MFTFGLVPLRKGIDTLIPITHNYGLKSFSQKMDMPLNKFTNVLDLVEMIPSNRFVQSLLTNNFFSLRTLSADKKEVMFLTSVFMLGRYLLFKKFTYTTLANSPRSRPHFILNSGDRAAMFFFCLSRVYHPFCRPGINVLALLPGVSYLFFNN